MEQKILDRITELTNKINDLLAKREDLIRDLKATENSIDITYNSIHELKNLLSDKEIENEISKSSEP